jgi:putative ABC transport system permease protein
VGRNLRIVSIRGPKMSEFKHHTPPAWAAFLLRHLIKDDAQTPEGDYEEYYSSIANDRGVRSALAWYVLQLVRLVPERLSARLYWSAVMWKSYITIGRRNLVKNKTASFINVFGLSVAIASCIAVFLVVRDSATMDNFHENRADIYLINHDVVENDELGTWGMSPLPLGPALADEFPQVKHAVRLQRSRGSFVHNDKVLSEAILFADNAFFDMFTFPLRLGTPGALADIGSVIISDATAEKYFGGQNPIGEEIALSFATDELVPFVIGGVAEPFRTNSSFTFDVLLSYDSRHAVAADDRLNWAAFTTGTFIQLIPDSDISEISSSMDRFVDIQNAANEDWAVVNYQFENLRDKGLTAFMVFRRAIDATEWPFMIVMIIIPIFMLALSCINYVNITLGSTTRRLKEIGIRKVVGSSKNQLVMQFLAENMILCFLSMIIGMFIAAIVLVPVFNNLFVVPIQFRLLGDVSLWVFLVVLLFGVGFLSGAYPAFYVSSFQPIAILRRHESIRRTAWLTRSLMTVQFALAFITVIVSAYLNSNNEHLLSLDWGYEPENTLVVQLQEEGQFELLRSELSQYPAFSKIAGGQNHIGQGLAATRINLEGIEQTVRSLSVGTGYFESMGIEIRSGRGFPQNREAEDRTSVVVNQAFADEYGWDDPLDRSFKLENTEFTVVGLIGNVMTNLVASNYPVFFQTSEIEDYSVATMLIATGSEKGAMEIIDDVWPKIFPGSPVDYFLQREIFDISFGSLKRLNQMFVAIAFLALFIACMGLFGLASQNVAARVKELAIRKSLGASDASLNIVLNRSFMMLLGLAAILTTPLCYFGINGLLGIVKSNNLVLGGSPFVIAYLVVLTTATMTVAIQARKIARLNPADVLKSE